MVNIFGYEIQKANKFSKIKVVQNNQATKPSRPLKSSTPREEIGDSGTRITRGLIQEEYNPNLKGIEGIKIYDEMRRSDGTVRAAILATTLPIRRAEWIIKSASEDPKDIEVKTFVEHALFEWLDLSWDDVIRQALLMIPFGVMVFEKVYGVKSDGGKDYITLKKLAPRLPRSISSFELDDGTFGIKQYRQDGQVAEIPGSKLLIFVNEREGDNWFGTSMLRAAYKHWYFKNNFYKIDAMAFERQGMGIPVMHMPTAYTQNDENRARNALENLRANENQYLILPKDYEFEFASMGASSTRDPEKSIAHHNKQILVSVLAQFLELGMNNTGGGSRALSEDQSDLFLKAMEAIANTIVSEINKKLIPELVDMNFDGITVYPKLDYTGIIKVDVKALAEAYEKLSTSGAIKPIEADEQYLRGALGLPMKTQEDMDEEDDNEDPEDTLEEDLKDKEVEDKTKKVKETQVEEMHEHTHTKKFSDEFKYWRKLTFAEKKVSFGKIDKKLNEIEKEFQRVADELLKEAKDAYMVKLQKAIDSGDTKAIAELEIKIVADYKSKIKETMRSAYEYGKSNISTEMGVKVPPNTADSLAQIDLMADTIAAKTASELEAKAKLMTANALKNDRNLLQTVGAIDLALEELITKKVVDTSGIIVGQSINFGRSDVIERNTGMVYALQRSEILDMQTCTFCLSMDGRIVKPDDKEWANQGVFHNNCRGIWVAILNDEQDKPPVNGVPSNLAAYYGGEPNELIQPKKPIVDENSIAKEEADRRKNDK